VAKMLNLFISPPFSLWMREYNYGEPLADDAGAIADEVGLATAETDMFLFAACGGELSVGAPIYTPVGPEELPDPEDPESIVEVVDLCLKMNPIAHAVTDFLGAAGAVAATPGVKTDIFAFLYWNVDVASLMEDLREALRWSTVPPGGENIDDDELARRMSQFLTGQLSVYVDAGQRLGRPGPHPDPAATLPFHVGLSVVTSSGLWNPGDVYDRYRMLVEEESDVDDFLVLVPRPPNPFSAASSKSAAIELTETRLYPFTDLLTLRSQWQLTRADWRRVGDNQKELYRQQLLARHGLGPTGAGASPFEFNSADWQNLFQLEAIVEFYINFPDPWAPNARPIDVQEEDRSSIDRASLVLQGAHATKPGDLIQLDGAPDLSGVAPYRHKIYLAASKDQQWFPIESVDADRKRVKAITMTGQPAVIPAAGSAWRIHLYQVVDFLPLEGSAASIAGSEVTLDASTDLSTVKGLASEPSSEVLRDGIIFFASEPDRMYRIAGVDQESFSVRLADAPGPAVGSTSAWRISRVPNLVLIDAFGPREGLKGTRATVAAGAPDTVHLDGPAPKLNKVSPGGFDTIYLPQDTARPRRTYRILQADPAAHTVTLDGSPTLAGGASAWSIPAGLGGTLPAMNYTLGPGPEKDVAGGFDHYDGAMFVIDDGAVTDQFRYTSFTSRTNKADNRRSILGNHRYDVVSFTSRDSAYRNYCFKVDDRSLPDNVFDSRAYFDAPVSPGGQRRIRLHFGNQGEPGSGSAGCNVSPHYPQLRHSLIESFQRRHILRQGAGGSRDEAVERLGRSVLNTDTKKLWNRTFKPPPASAGEPAGLGSETVTAEAWDGTIFCHYWLIRPDERPHTD
jgi:hypothetical protein